MVTDERLVVLNRVDARQLPAGVASVISIDVRFNVTAGMRFTVTFVSAYSEGFVRDSAVITVVPSASAVNVPNLSMVPTVGFELYQL